jgi:hypothetical protein
MKTEETKELSAVQDAIKDGLIIKNKISDSATKKGVDLIAIAKQLVKRSFEKKKV